MPEIGSLSAAAGGQILSLRSICHSGRSVPISAIFFILLLMSAGVFCAKASAAVPHFSGVVSLTSDYFWRGYSKSDGDLSLQGNLDLSFVEEGSGAFTGLWLAGVNPVELGSEGEGGTETLLYAGWTQPLTENLRFEAQISHYLYNIPFFGKDADYTEYYVYFHYRDWLSADLAYSDDAYGTGESAYNYQLTFRYPLNASLDFSANYGEYDTENRLLDDYRYWSVGVTWKRHRYALDLRYAGMTETAEHQVERTEGHLREHGNSLFLVTFSVSLF